MMSQDPRETALLARVAALEGSDPEVSDLATALGELADYSTITGR